MASLTSTAFAAFQAPLPEFKNEKQLAEWRAEKASDTTSQGYAAEEAAFYTGKPYLVSSGDYAFKYRNYNPELARWTSEDPSGYPDGANSNIYTPNPASEVDFMGLLAINTSLAGSSSHYYLPSDPLGPGYTVKSEDLGNLSASNFNQTFAGWTFNTGSLNATLNITAYQPTAMDTYGVCALNANIYDQPLLASGEQYCWIQVVTCNVVNSSGIKGTFLDIAQGQTTPFYAGNSSPGAFVDGPQRSYSQLQDVIGGGPITWKGELYYGKYSNTNVTLYGGVTWKFSIFE